MSNHDCHVMEVAVVFLQSGHNSSETQMHGLQAIQLSACEVQECKTFPSPVQFSNTASFLPTVGNICFQFFDDKTQNFPGLTNCCDTHFLFNFPPSFISLPFSDCFLLAFSSAVPPLLPITEVTIAPMEKCLCEYKLSPCLQEYVKLILSAPLAPVLHKIVVQSVLFSLSLASLPFPCV